MKDNGVQENRINSHRLQYRFCTMISSIDYDIGHILIFLFFSYSPPVPVNSTAVAQLAASSAVLAPGFDRQLDPTGSALPAAQRRREWAGLVAVLKHGRPPGERVYCSIKE